MKVEFLAHFSKDLDKICNVHIKQAVQRVIVKIESVESLSEILNFKNFQATNQHTEFALVIIESEFLLKEKP